MEERRYALLIGNHEYADPSDFTPLNSPSADVTAMKKVLEAPEHGHFEVQTLINQPRSETLKAIKSALAKKRKSDLQLIYFSGHGKTDDHGDLYLATAGSESDQLEATALDARQVSELLGRSHAEKTVLILDCCHAGAFPAGFKSDDMLQAAAKNYANAGGAYVLMACGEFELAKDGGDGELSHLTQHLVEGLQGAADVNQDGVVSVKELTDYLDRVMARGGGQKFNQSGQNQRGDIIMSKSGKTPLKQTLANNRKTLSEWLADGHISDEVSVEVLEYFKELGADGEPDSDPRWTLLQDLSENEIGSGVFVQRWIEAKSSQLQKPGAKPDAKPQEKPKAPARRKPATKAKTPPKPNPPSKPKPASRQKTTPKPKPAAKIAALSSHEGKIEPSKPKLTPEIKPEPATEEQPHQEEQRESVLEDSTILVADQESWWEPIIEFLIDPAIFMFWVALYSLAASGVIHAVDAAFGELIENFIYFELGVPAGKIMIAASIVLIAGIASYVWAVIKAEAEGDPVEFGSFVLRATFVIPITFSLIQIINPKIMHLIFTA